LHSSITNIVKQSIEFFKKHEKAILIVACGLVVLRFAWLNYINWHSGAISNGMPGIKYWLDTGRYIGGAEKIINGTAFEHRENQFLGYMLLISVTKILNLPLVSIVIIQVLTALLAAWALFDIGNKLANNKYAGFIAAALFLCNPFIVQWHQYILTESLYTSFVIFSFWSLANILKNKKPLNYVLSVAILISTMLLRPNGWILLPVFVIFYFITSGFERRTKLILAGITIMIFIITATSVSVFRNSIQITTPMQNLQNGVTVWNHPELAVKMPKEPNLNNDKLSDGIKYVARHPLSSLKLGAIRASYTLIHIRPYHSINYKIRVLMWIIPAYIFAIIGLFAHRKKQITLAGLLIIAGHLLVVALTYAEHDSRFDIYILSVFYIFAGAGIVSVLRKLHCLIFKDYKNI
jgi:4-amino-4-deoxy-L-arabinose transferase-like glycosyltransferase